ncbi:hypothetical protein ACFLRB_05555, partial [Acidobacteriota bacterium]
MKILKTIFLLLLIIFLMLDVLPVIGQEAETKPEVKEEVKVVNAEVPVRVFYKGKPVDNLTIGDFKLYENKKKQTISSLNIVRRKIDAENKNPRYFVFLVRAYHFNDQFREGVRYIFDHILKKEDTLMVLVNDESMMIDRLTDKEDAFQRLEKLITNQSQRDRGKLISNLKRIEQEIDLRSFRYSLSQGNFILVQNFLKKYLRIWKDYKQKYLLPNLNRYYHFAKQLEKIKKEKWVINFYQMEMMPNIIIPGEIKRSLNRFTDNLLESPKAEDVSYGRILRTLSSEIEKQTNIVFDFPVEEISKLFHKVDATFHTVFMRTTIGVEQRDHESMKITSDMERCLGDITRATGGKLVSTSNVRDAVDRIVEAENIHYILTYAPKNPEKAGKLKIKAGKKKYKVLYDDNMRVDYEKEYSQKETGKQNPEPNIHIKDLYLKDKKLIISIDEFLTKKSGKYLIGKIRVHVCIK